MTREQAIHFAECLKNNWTINFADMEEFCDMAIEALSAEAVQGYTEWLEKIIVEAETFEWICEDDTDEEWREKNCNYASIQAECLRHLYEVSKGGDTE